MVELVKSNSRPYIDIRVGCQNKKEEGAQQTQGGHQLFGQ